MAYDTHRSSVPRVIVAVVTAALAAAALAACQPEPIPTGTSTATSTPSAPSGEPSPAPSETESPASADDIALPASCEAIYSPEMLASLNAQNPPLNDPGVTMNSSQNVDALELLSSGIPTIRCSWGQPSEHGLATNVSLIEPAQASALAAAFQTVGFECVPHAGGDLCRLETRMIDLDDNEVRLGETHYLRGNGWISTAWINFAPQGYTEDIVATLWP